MGGLQAEVVAGQVRASGQAQVRAALWRGLKPFGIHLIF
jgi:hypothetical protein